MAHRLDKFTEELFGNRCIYFDRNTIYQHFYIRVIWANRAIRTNGRKCRCGCSWRRVRAWENRKWEWNNIWQGLVNNFFLEKMFPVVIGVKWKTILFIPLPDSKTAGFLVCKSDGSFLKMDLMKLLFCIHEIILLDKVTRIAKIERIARSRVRNIVRAIISEIW